jgi:hypothetical protein
MGLLTNKDTKFLAYYVLPGLMAILLLLPVFRITDWSILCVVTVFGLFEFFLLLSVSETKMEEASRESDELRFQTYMGEQGYDEVPGEPKIRFVGRAGNDPVAVKTDTGIQALMIDDSRDQVPIRYFFYNAGSADQYLLVWDGLEERYRLFKK